MRGEFVLVHAAHGLADLGIAAAILLPQLLGIGEDLDIEQIAAGVGELQLLDVQFVQHKLLQSCQPSILFLAGRAYDHLSQRLAHLQVGVLAGGMAKAGDLLGQRHVPA